MAGKALCQYRSHLHLGERPVRYQFASRLRQRLEIQTGERRTLSAVGVEIAFHDRLHRGPEGTRIGGRESKDRAPHGNQPHHLAILDKGGEVFCRKVLQPRPQCQVGRIRRLSLQSCQVLDRIQRAYLGASKQELPRQSRQVELAIGDQCSHRQLLNDHGRWQRRSGTVSRLAREFRTLHPVRPRTTHPRQPHAVRVRAVRCDRRLVVRQSDQR